jgi:GNAT superfamily N-acetyltransferase
VGRRTEPIRPPGYPAGYETAVRLADGREVDVRPILPTDADELAEAIRSADPQTLRSRFLGAPPPITRALLAGLTELDYVRRFAMVARADDQGVGIARYIALGPPDAPPVEAEIAVAVAVDWRRVGLATQLITLLARRARECGITSFTATYWSQNRPVVELADDMHARVVISDGIAELRARLNDGAF